METTERPTPYLNIWVTYEKQTYNAWGTTTGAPKIIVTKRGFYCPNSERNELTYDVAIPPGWQNFTFSNGTTSLLPHGWGGDRLKWDQVISWKYDENVQETCKPV